MKLLTTITAATLLLSVNADAQDNYTVSLQLLDKNRNKIVSYSSLMSGSGNHSQINHKSYAITECTETSQKKTRSFKGKEFLSGYTFSVNPHNGAVKFTEYGVDDSKYNDYDKSKCFNEEVKQIKFTSNQKVEVGNKEFQEYLLPSGKILNLAIYK